MNVYQAHLHAEQASLKLLTAHAYASSMADPEWERHSLMVAIESFDRLADLMPAVRAQLAALTQHDNQGEA